MKNSREKPLLIILLALGMGHLLNDILQSLISGLYPIFKDSMALNFTQIGLITLVFQLSSSVFQPVVGWYTDKRPKPYTLPFGMLIILIGFLILSFSENWYPVLISVTLIGFGSSVFHPEASKLAHIASGGKHGLAQSIFQVGGNIGGSLGPLFAALFIAPYELRNVVWCSIIALVAIGLMMYIGKWYKLHLKIKRLEKKEEKPLQKPLYNKRKTKLILMVLLILIFSKYVYMASLTSYYTFYLIDKFHISIQNSQFYLFGFLFAIAVGTFIGGPIGDRYGRKYVIWGSIFGAAPFALMMPYANLFGTCILSLIIGLILSSAFSSILVYAEELLPGNEGIISGLFFGLAFGIAGIASAVLGKIADIESIGYVYKLCSFFPLLGFIAYFLPNEKRVKRNVI